MTKPRFIVLDGLDGTGKTTQCDLLANWLRQHGIRVMRCADPGGTATGDVIRQLLLSNRSSITMTCESFLFMASRAQLVAEIIRPALARGEWVISDRFLLANVVYQGHAGGMDVGLLWEMGRLAAQGASPDLTIVLDMPTAAARARRGDRPADRMESRQPDYQERVRQGFLQEAEQDQRQIRVVDAACSVEIVHAQLRRILEPFLEA